jgi:hypothetical protein
MFPISYCPNFRELARCELVIPWVNLGIILTKRSQNPMNSVIDHCRSEQLCRIELRDGEPVKPTFTATRAAADAKTVHVPLAGFDPVAATLTKQER